MKLNNLNRLDEILTYNKKFVENKAYEEFKATKHPEKKLVIISCMDTRLTELLPKAMNIKNGDAKIIKDAGATVMHPFASIVRSILVAIYEFNAEDILVVGHHGCGMSNLDTDSLIKKMIKRGIAIETIETLNNAGINVEEWLHGFESVEESLKKSVELIKKHPLVPKDVNVHALVIDPHTGELEVVVNGYEH